ncbi:MAG TPA: hypothetical protein VGM67_19790 [Gemmatimonadaceae bacterium]
MHVPVVTIAARRPGGATHLAARVSYALAEGYYDFGSFEMVNTSRNDQRDDQRGVLTGEDGARRR